MALCVAGIDPGLKGAIAFFFPDHPERVSVEDMPVAAGEVDAATLSRRLKQFAPDFAVVELVHSMPKEGVSSAFKFGFGCGVVRGVLAACEIPVHLVTPGAWKRHFRLPADKEMARALALRLFPAVSQHFARKKDHGRSEAALIARYGAEVVRPDRSLTRQNQKEDA